MAKCKDCTECILINMEKKQFGCYNSRPLKYVNINKYRQCSYFRRKRNE